MVSQPDQYARRRYQFHFETGERAARPSWAYTVVVRNLFGAVTSNPAILTVSASPAILTPPVNQTAVVGDTVDFAVTAAGSPPLAYQWVFNRTNALDGAIHPTLELVNVQPEQAGAYTVVVTNASGRSPAPRPR